MMKTTKTVPYSAVRFTGGLWQHRQQQNQSVTMPAVHARFSDTGRFAALACQADYSEDKKPHIFWDSDVAKWLEAAAYILKQTPDAWLEDVADECAALIEKNQGADGYFNSYFQVVDPDMRFENRDAHELYCAGHLIEAAVAYYEATGKDTLLRCMCRYADYIEKVFKIENSAEFVTCGHEEIELALVRLYRCTGEKRYLALAQYFVEQRGRNGKDLQVAWMEPSYGQSHLPVREQTTAEGHSVRAMYLYCAMADLALETGDDTLLAALQTLFANVTEKRMYITGGIGSSPAGEAFTIDYDLPNMTAYAETCAAIGLALLARRMSALEADGRYADTAEKAIYNGVYSGLSLNGRAFFYENPLEVNPALHGRDASVKSGKTRYPILERREVFDCSCCPPNLTRFTASFGEFLYTKTADTLLVHHYAHSSAALDLGGAAVEISQETEYPNDGAVKLTVKGMTGKTLALRIPGWCEKYMLVVDGAQVRTAPQKGYVYLPISAEACEILLKLTMTPQLIMANPAVGENAGHVALTRGPLVYCLEEADNGKNLRSLAVKADSAWKLQYDEGMRANAILAEGTAPLPMDALYAAYSPSREDKPLRFIPYNAFANRSVGEMLVWVQPG